MAMNPMQRRARTSFILGFLVALVIGALAVIALLVKIKSINEAKEALEALQRKVYVASADIESGQEVTIEDFKKGIVQSELDKKELLEDIDFEFTDDSGEIVTKLDDQGNELKKNMYMKINVPAGSIITKDMLYSSDEEIDASTRIQEFNMILLPSQLKNGDYIDVRFAMPSGQEFVVLSKKKVIGTDTTSVWLQLNELELNLINNAIVESYMLASTKLYAIEYVEAGMQAAAIPTYVASVDVMNAINNNPNITGESADEYGRSIANILDYRSGIIEPVLDSVRNNRDGAVASGNSKEIENVKAQRKKYIDSLEGTDSIGLNEK